jgi:UDP-GlcNAc3NAcA epimerase
MQTRVVLPLHPRTRKVIKKNNLKLSFSPLEPVGYFDIIELLKHCRLVITDSGGMQKEAYFFGKYCITLREETEWVELVNNKVNLLAGTSEEKILSSFKQLSDRSLITITSLYGDGKASEKIVKLL